MRKHVFSAVSLRLFSRIMAYKTAKGTCRTSAAEHKKLSLTLGACRDRVLSRDTFMTKVEQRLQNKTAAAERKERLPKQTIASIGASGAKKRGQAYSGIHLDSHSAAIEERILAHSTQGLPLLRFIPRGKLVPPQRRDKNESKDLWRCVGEWFRNEFCLGGTKFRNHLMINSLPQQQGPLRQRSTTRAGSGESSERFNLQGHRSQLDARAGLLRALPGRRSCRRTRADKQ